MINDNSNKIVQINTKVIHLIYVLLAVAVILVTSVWSASTYIASAKIKEWTADSPVRDAVKIWVMENTVSQKDFNEWKTEVKISLDEIKRLLRENNK